MKKFGILFIALVGLTVSSFGQAGQSVDANSTATIVKPLTLTNLTSSSLAFGKIAVTAVGNGDVTIAASAGATAALGTTAGITLANGLPTSPAKFELTGEPSASYLLTYDGTATLNGSVSGTMTVTLTGNHATGSSNVIPGPGTEDLYIGGSLAIVAGQPSGAYTGTFNITVAYN